MDLTRLIEGIFRRVLMQLVNRGVKAGIDRMAGGGKPQDPAQDKAARDLAKRARQAAKLTRRL